MLIFLPTRHDIVYFAELLKKFNIQCTFIYSSLSQEARDANMNRLKTNRVSILLATDIAARGIDIPDLSVVINYSIPAKPKVFMHRVGRVARMASRGLAVNIMDQLELPSFIATLRFLDFDLKLEPGEAERDSYKFMSEFEKPEKEFTDKDLTKKREGLLNLPSSGYLGQLDDSFLQTYISSKQNFLKDINLYVLRSSKTDAAKKYAEFAPKVDQKSLRIYKELMAGNFEVNTHQLFAMDTNLTETNNALKALLNGIKTYKAKTVFYYLFLNSTKYILKGIKARFQKLFTVY